MAQNIPRIVRGRTELRVQHNGNEIAFAYPSVGPNTYMNVGAEILNRKQKIPTGDETASLLYAAYCIPEVKDEPEFKNVRDIMRDKWIWVFNRNLWIANGVYVLQDSQAIGRNDSLNVNQLEEMLKGGEEREGIRFSNDRKVRFAPKKTYQLGEHTQNSLAKDGFMIASYGKEGAEKLAEASTHFKLKPSTWGVETNNQEQKVSALSIYVGGRLGFGGDFAGNWDGHAFGVLD
ncbi:hypothetical protein HZA33_02150 [Candidatus Pacearchaeota archaeon]|nr:hypothetical protein [Candidatus Pacearchaeota archaeon]